MIHLVTFLTLARWRNAKGSALPVTGATQQHIWDKSKQTADIHKQTQNKTCRIETPAGQQMQFTYNSRKSGLCCVWFQKVQADLLDDLGS